ncbi:MAG: DUF6468 domain-containing protein [Rhodospirillaceae bacterium]
MSVILDIFLIVLLCMAIGYGFALNRRIVALRKDQKNLEKLAASFADATAKAESSVYQLKATTDSAGLALQETVTRSEGVRDDLEFLIDRANKIADLLEEDIRTTEGWKPPASKIGLDREPANEQTRTENTAKNEAERELIKALQAVR